MDEDEYDHELQQDKDNPWKRKADDIDTNNDEDEHVDEHLGQGVNNTHRKLYQDQDYEDDGEQHS